MLSYCLGCCFDYQSIGQVNQATMLIISDRVFGQIIMCSDFKLFTKVVFILSNILMICINVSSKKSKLKWSTRMWQNNPQVITKCEGR